MPQAPEWLRRRFPKGDAQAIKALEADYNLNKGVITKKDPAHRTTRRQSEAIAYLVHEWDYAYIRP